MRFLSAAGTAASYYSNVRKLFENGKMQAFLALGGFSLGISLCYHYDEKNYCDAHRNQSSLTRLFHPHVTWNEASNLKDRIPTQKQPFVGMKNRNNDNSSRKTTCYDFIVIGYGNAGRGAVEALQQECPSAKVAVIDPFAIKSDSKNVEHIRCRAIGIRPHEHTIEIAFSDEVVDDPVQQLQYRYAALIATGARGAPPPRYLMDEQAWNRILEMRATIIPNSKQKRPVLSPKDVRDRIRKSSQAGETIGVLGCGWDAIDIALEASSYSPSKSQSRPSLFFGSSAPLSNVLPKYLSSALAKRLRSKGIDVHDRSVVRYISYDDQSDKLHLYTAKSYDLMDGNSTKLDLLVIAPDMHGPRGTAAMPTDEVPDFLEESAEGRSWYQTWSNLSVMSMDDASLISCYKDDGRITVNSELSVCTGLYAAGSVAKCANNLTGHAVVAGVGIPDGKAAGRVAGMNMAHSFNFSRSSSDYPYNIFKSGLGSSSSHRNRITLDPIPIWRSDLRSYSCDNEEDENSCLSEAGVTALCVGNCDSESLGTHGVWWTNQAAQRRLQHLFDATPSEEDDPDTIRKKMLARKHIRKSLKPVYGLGVVFYLNRVGRIQGVMTWGIPFTRSANDRSLNEELVNTIKSIIKTNGGIRVLETELDQIRMSEYLTIVSKQLIAIAFAGQSAASAAAHNVHGALEQFPRPLHQYTELRLPSVRSAGVLRRKDGQGQGLLGEDMFVRYEDDSIPDHPPPAPHPTLNVGFAVKKVEAGYEWSLWEQTEKRWDENEARARPPKEDPLWIRKGDEARNISRADRIATAYKSHLDAYIPG